MKAYILLIFQGFYERVFFRETFSILFPAKFLDRVSCVVSLCVRRGGVDGESIFLSGSFIIFILTYYCKLRDSTM